MSEQVITRRLFLLTVGQLSDQVVAFPRPACLTLRRDGRAKLVLDERSCTFDTRFRQALQTAWDYVRALLPQESDGLSLHLAVKAQGCVAGRSAGLPLTLALLSALLEAPLPDTLFSSGLMLLPDGWFTGRRLSRICAKARALAALARHRDRPVTLAIPHHPFIPLPDPLPRVRYLELINVVQAAAEIFTRHAERVQQRFQLLSSVERLPLEPGIKAAFQKIGAQTIILQYGSPSHNLRVQTRQEAWGPTVWARYPQQFGGVMIYRFEGKKLFAKEQFANWQDAQTFSQLLSGSRSGGCVEVPESHHPNL